MYYSNMTRCFNLTKFSSIKIVNQSCVLQIKGCNLQKHIVQDRHNLSHYRVQLNTVNKLDSSYLKYFPWCYNPSIEITLSSIKKLYHANCVFNRSDTMKPKQIAQIDFLCFILMLLCLSPVGCLSLDFLNVRTQQNFFFSIGPILFLGFIVLILIFVEIINTY